MATNIINQPEKSIKFNRKTKDYDCYLGEQYIGSAATYIQGEELCNTTLYQLLEDRATA